MNILKSISIGLIFFTPILTSSHAMAEGASSVHGYSIDEMEDRIKSGIESVVQIVKPTYNSRVRSYLRTYIELSPQHTEIMMGRAEMYFDLFEAYLDKYNMPRDLKYLAVVESALVPGATSHSGAGGIWQFMRATGREYGLRITQYIDERRDPAKSTEAAVRYLKKLYERFGTWELAMAAYNAGPGRVNSAIRRSGTNDYWKLNKYLPRETRSYVPGFIAVNYLFHHYADHNLEPKSPDSELLDTYDLPIYDGLSLLEASKITGVSYNTIKVLNPTYSRRYIPRSTNGYALRLPKYAIGVMQKYLGYPEISDELMASLSPVFTGLAMDYEERTTMHQYQVVSGDNLYDIARAHGCSVRKLMQWNKLQTAHLAIGQELIIEIKERVAIPPSLEDRLVDPFPPLQFQQWMPLESAARELPVYLCGQAVAEVTPMPQEHVVVRRRMSVRDAIRSSRRDTQFPNMQYESALPGSVVRFRN